MEQNRSPQMNIHSQLIFSKGPSLTKQYIFLPCEPAITFPNIVSNHLKIHAHSKNYAEVNLITLFIIAKTSKQSKQLQQVHGSINIAMSRRWAKMQSYKQMSQQDMHRHEGNVNILLKKKTQSEKSTDYVIESKYRLKKNPHTT